MSAAETGFAGRVCPKCGATDILLIDLATEGEAETWKLDPEAFDEDAEVWVCQAYGGRFGGDLCGWHEEADPDEALDYHLREIEWLRSRIAGGAS